MFFISFWFQGISISWLPGCLFGCVSLIAGIIASILPETTGKHLPDSIKNVRDKEKEEIRL